MNDKEKLEFVKEEITKLNYLNSILTDAISYHQETSDINPQFLYLNDIMKDKFANILSTL